jgi:hypothetical protein
MRYIDPIRVKVLMMLFYATGIMGLIIGLVVAPPSMTMTITFMALVNVGLGAFSRFYFSHKFRKSLINVRKRKNLIRTQVLHSVMIKKAFSIKI